MSEVGGKRYYLGVRLAPITSFADEPGWVWAMWPDGRCFKHWAAQLTAEPWAIEGRRS